MTTEVDYGYGEAQPDYGYGDAQPDYGYEETQPAGQTDYGYGEAQPDYGYGETQPDPQTDYGYGEAQPDYGYGEEAAPPVAPSKARRRETKRRCSVTKYSLEQTAANSVDAEIAQQLQAAELVQRFRQGEVNAGDEKSTLTEGTAVSDGGSDPEEPHPPVASAGQVESTNKKGMLNKIRKRLSISFS